MQYVPILLHSLRKAVVRSTVIHVNQLQLQQFTHHVPMASTVYELPFGDDGKTRLIIASDTIARGLYYVVNRLRFDLLGARWFSSTRLVDQ